VVITDIDSGRVQWAERNGFAHKGWTMPLRKASSVDEKLEVARSVPGSLEKDGLPGRYDAVFECTGAEACLQAAIYVSSISLTSHHYDFVLYIHIDVIRRQNLVAE
jgi:L-iditol 2-dehydrogenase